MNKLYIHKRSVEDSSKVNTALYWAKYFEPYLLPMYKKALAQLNLSEDHTVLDTGCGAGLFSGLAIETGAKLIGIDPVPALLDLARLRNPNNVFLEGGRNLLPFFNDSFHVVTAFNSFRFTNNFTAFFSEVKRVLKESGRLVLGLWDKASFNDASSVYESLNTLLPTGIQKIPDPFLVAENGSVENIIERTGLNIVYRTRIACPFLYNNPVHAVNGFMSTRHAIAATHYTDKETVEKTIAESLDAFRLTDEIYFLQNHFLLFIAEK
jgi:SAM-dependent methyltransferase